MLPFNIQAIINSIYKDKNDRMALDKSELISLIIFIKNLNKEIEELKDQLNNKK